MAIIYKASFHYETKGKEKKLFIKRTLPDGTRDKNLVNMEEIKKLEETCKDYKWNQSQELSKEIGDKLFDILNGDRQTLSRALNEADAHGENLQLIIRDDEPASNLPFELLYHNNFLVPIRIHLIRQVSDFGQKREPKPENRPLKILFMACSPQDASPVLDFEKEEDTIFEITKDLPVEIDIEDTGSPEGLGDLLTKKNYDVIHISGHADIDEDGIPIFWMENEEGLSVRVKPSQLQEKLDLNLPRLVFLSGCRTGESSQHAVKMSFANHLVSKHIPVVLGWGLPVSDIGASLASKQLYFELSRGENIPDSILRTRNELKKKFPMDWSLLRLFADGTPLDIPLVERGQKRRPKPRELQYTYLENSQVKVLKKGFIGRRREIQIGLHCLKKNEKKVGLLLHNTGGLGKSCLAGKFCERFKDHELIIVHGKLDAITFSEALKDAFFRKNDSEGREILKEKEEMPDKIRKLCSSVFQERNYLIVLDDFERNLEGVKEGKPQISVEAEPILEALLRYLPYSAKMTQLIITSRYEFSLTLNDINLVVQQLKSIGLTSFRGADERKKVSELKNIEEYPDEETKKKLIKLGSGNPRLMENLNKLIDEVKDLDIESLLFRAKGKKDEFIQKLVVREIIDNQSKEFQNFLCRSSVYRIPIPRNGIELNCGDIDNWETHLEKSVHLSLMEEDSTRRSVAFYWVSPLLREDIFKELTENEIKECHENAVLYYQNLLSSSESYFPVFGKELIEHSLKAGNDDIALEEGRRLLNYLRETLAYREALEQGKYIISQISEPKKDEKYSKFIFELGYIHGEMGDSKQEIEYLEQALSIDKEIYGKRHPNIATNLNNIGTALHMLGEYKKAIEYFELALSIDKEVYGKRHPNVATSLNNIGEAWRKLGNPKKAIEYFEQDLSIDKEIYGESHPNIATTLNNIGSTWYDLGEPKKAIEYYKKALSIDKEVYGERHPKIARSLNNIGLAWNALGEHKKAIEYYKQALSIDKEIYGERHPNIAIKLNNIGGAWDGLGEYKKAIEYFELALSIDKEVFGEKHPSIAGDLNNIGGALYDLGDFQNAKEYFQQAYDINQEFYGDEHPHTKATKEWLALIESKGV